LFKNAETVELKDDSVRVAAEECPKSAEVIVEKRVAVCVGVTESKKEGRKKTLLGRTDTPPRAVQMDIRTNGLRGEAIRMSVKKKDLRKKANASGIPREK